jgi:hypothetical protein
MVKVDRLDPQDKKQWRQGTKEQRCPNPSSHRNTSSNLVLFNYTTMRTIVLVLDANFLLILNGKDKNKIQQKRFNAQALNLRELGMVVDQVWLTF